MPDEKLDAMSAAQLRQRALSRWENEGGAGACGPEGRTIPGDGSLDVPPLTNAELSQLHIRVIALEGLVASLLAEATDRQLDLAREMAAYICPRRGSTDHPLTIRAATQMIDLVERAKRFRSTMTS